MARMKRLGLGLLAMAIVTSLLGLIPGPAFVAPGPDEFFFANAASVIWAAAVAAIGALVGGYLARHSFAGIAVASYAILFLVVVGILQSTAEPVQPVAASEVIARNSIGFGVTLLAVYFGANLGVSIYRRAKRGDAYAA